MARLIVCQLSYSKILDILMPKTKNEMEFTLEKRISDRLSIKYF